MTTLEALKWDGKKAGKVSIDLKVDLDPKNIELNLQEK